MKWHQVFLSHSSFSFHSAARTLFNFGRSSPFSAEQTSAHFMLSSPSSHGCPNHLIISDLYLPKLLLCLWKSSCILEEPSLACLKMFLTQGKCSLHKSPHKPLHWWFSTDNLHLPSETWCAKPEVSPSGVLNEWQKTRNQDYCIRTRQSVWLSHVPCLSETVPTVW